MSKSRNNDPFWWSLFGAGGVFSSFFIPAHIVLLGLALPLGWITLEYESLRHLVSNPIVRLYLFALISLSLFHAAHRIRFSLHDLLMAKQLDTPAAVLCYGAAIVGTLVTATTVWGL